jgi:hypothetical protein
MSNDRKWPTSALWTIGGTRPEPGGRHRSGATTVSKRAAVIQPFGGARRTSPASALDSTGPAGVDQCVTGRRGATRCAIDGRGRRELRTSLDAGAQRFLTSAHALAGVHPGNFALKMVSGPERGR